ncbi:hypothetical protein VVD49_20840 [Uliginosibacterium sp. H3]|uniref:Tetratricopeptide repeat protein n=1 Tax=Uliginosibacterium silvisoli TaxID=3114758 RepID=A0ABU6K8H3_9RHOO|nr:hypothetical protein [Uliginosibacterium sp. H3]
MIPDATRFESDLRSLIALGDLDGALAFIRFLVDHVRFDPAAIGVTLGSPALDKLCSEIGALTLAESRQRAAASKPARNADVIILATELYALGGHSRVIADLIATRPDKHHLILLSNFFDSAEAAAAQSLASATTQVEIAPVAGRLDKLLWLQTGLARHPDAQVYVFNHHGDAATIAAIQPGLNREVSFCHHADYHLCLGVHLDWVRHVDFFAPCQHRCRAAGIAAEYWPLSVPDRGTRSHETSSFGAGTALTTCSSGVWSKFDENYPFHYADVIGEILRASGGKHLHIGGIPDDGLARIHASLAAQGIARERFEHIPQVPSVWATLIEKQVDLYLGSFPIGGGRATTEALGAGIPVVTHRHQLDPLLGAWGLGPAGTWSWATLQELGDILRQLTPARLAEHSLAARQHYLTHHSPGVFAQCVQTGQPATPPDFPAPPNDRLVSYLLRSAVRQESHTPVIEELHKRLQAVTEAGGQTSMPRTTQAPAAGGIADAIALYEAGNLEEAGAAFSELHARQPGEPQALTYLGLIALRAGMPDDARTFFTHAAGSSKDAANTQAAIGQRCLELGEAALAIDYLEAALKTNPALVGAYALLADALQQRGNAERALALLKPLMQQTRELHPEILLRIARLAAATGETGTEQAACMLGRQYAECHSRLLQLMAQYHDTAAATLLEETKSFVEKHAKVARSSLSAGSRSRLRAGFVVGSIDSSPITQHLESLLCELDGERFETLLFFDRIHDMASAQRLSLIVDESHTFAGMDPLGAAQLVRTKHTDILISLEWHAQLPALMIFSQRAAPVQINYSRPARSSALANMDYIVSAAADSSHFTERVLHLPHDDDPIRYASSFGDMLVEAWQACGGSLGVAA